MLKLSFTTLGCPDWTLQQIVENAARMGYDAVDFRGLQENLDISTTPAFTTGLNATRRMFADAGLAISGIATSARFAVIDAAELQANYDETRRNMDLAARLGAKFLRVYGGRVPEGHTVDSILPTLIDNLRHIGDEAAQYDVTLVLETHDDWTNSAVFGKLMREVDHPRVRVLWDLHHPFRTNGEPPQMTYANIGSYTASIHVKDSVPTADGGHRYVLLGEGDVPLQEMLDLLVSGGYDGYAILEWEKRWILDLPAPEIAFPQYVEKMRVWLA
ncbi:MAG: sugar phosphate isomerase/epimerase [Anaerolineales bacterium]|nr:MAG: sugar phosphate isomerase/epimerase [Anaerolineales bacterium]